jgi:hypothetical protein
MTQVELFTDSADNVVFFVGTWVEHADQPVASLFYAIVILVGRGVRSVGWDDWFQGVDLPIGRCRGPAGVFAAPGGAALT